MSLSSVRNLNMRGSSLPFTGGGDLCPFREIHVAVSMANLTAWPPLAYSLLTKLVERLFEQIKG